MPIQTFVVVFAAVFAAEVLGDKLLYTTGLLATRYRPTPMMVGIAVAFMAKMGVAVAIGHALTALPRALIAVMTAISFGWIAWRLWSGKAPESAAGGSHSTSSEAAVVSFASVFFSEWGDVGQLTAATLAAQTGAPMVVWIAAVAAMSTKAALAATLGVKIRPWMARSVPQRAVRVGGVTVMLVLGALSVVETLSRGR
jgi:putative Ca2+/H+ antiporter (TMEM165/GDT1 family)